MWAEEDVMFLALNIQHYLHSDTPSGLEEIVVIYLYIREEMP